MPFIYRVTLDPKVTPTAEYLHGTVLWHIDGFSDDLPARASILSARKLSAIGGQTEFANTYAAYSELSDERKLTLEKLLSSRMASRRHDDLGQLWHDASG